MVRIIMLYKVVLTFNEQFFPVVLSVFQFLSSGNFTKCLFVIFNKMNHIFTWNRGPLV